MAPPLVPEETKGEASEQPDGDGEKKNEEKSKTKSYAKAAVKKPNEVQQCK